MDDGVVFLVGFQMRDFHRPNSLQGAGERVIEGGPRQRVTHGRADLPEGAEYLGPVEALAGAVVAEAHAVQDATDRRRAQPPARPASRPVTAFPCGPSRRCCMKTLRWSGLARISHDPPQDPHYRDEVEGPSHV